MTSESRPIRVLYAINGLGTGGAERSLAELVMPLREHGVQIRIACLEHRSAGVEADLVGTTDVDFVGPGLLRAGRKLRSLMRATNPDVIHTTIFESDIVGRLASIGTGIPVVSSVVNTSYEVPAGPHPDASSAKLRLVRSIDGFTARHFVTRFHTLTRASAASAARSLGIPRERIDVIPRGRDTARLGRRTVERRMRVREELGLSGQQPILLSVGRREHQKGQIHAIEAMPEILSRHPEAVLVIAGRDGAASGRLSGTAVSAGVEQHVLFLGHREDVPDLMSAADALLFPSLYEGFGGTVIEAMALELPIIASDIPTLREVTSSAAILTPLASSAELADAVLRLLDDQQFADELRSAGMRRFQENFTLDAVAVQMARFYRTVVRGGGE